MADLDAGDREKIPTNEFGLPEKARTKEAKKHSGTTPCPTRRMPETRSHALLKPRRPAICPKKDRERIDRKADKILDK